MSQIVDWLIRIALILGVLRLSFSLLPRWLLLVILTVLIWQLLHPQALRHVVSAVVNSDLLEPSLELGLVLVGMGLIVKGFGAGKKR